MKKRRFGKEDPAPTREELEKEAARELEQMTRQANRAGPSGMASGWSATRPAPSFQPAFGSGVPAAPGMPSVRDRFEARDQEDEEDDEGDYSEEEMVTELALRDWSERSGRGRSIEDLALPRIDPASVEAQRDRALREFTERQARMEKQSEADRIQRQAMGLTPPSRAGTVNLTAARPMGMLNLSAQAAGMRGQGAGASGVSDGPEPKSSRKPAAGKAKPKTKTNVPSTPGPAGSKAGEPASGKAAKKVTKTAKAPGKPSATKTAKAPGKPSPTKTAKAPGKPSPTKTAKAPGKPSPTKATAARAKKAPVASATLAKKKKAVAPAKASPSARKGSGRH